MENRPFSEMSMDTKYWPMVGVSFIGWMFMYKVVSPAVSGALIPKYKSLTEDKRQEWDSRFNSSVHSLVSSIACIYSLLYDEYIQHDPVWGDSAFVRSTCAMVVGYMTFDCVTILLNYKDKSDLFYVLHHFAAVYAFCFTMTYGVLTWFANFRIIAELSTPFVNQRWYLDVLDYPKNSKLCLVNGIVMAVMFFLVRIALMPIYWYKVLTIIGTEPCDRLGKTFHILTSSCFILDAINIYWMYRIVLGARKVLRVTLDKNRNVPAKDEAKQS